ncbi:MAG: hypothetical protein JNL01_03165 [Bdellovibrionales bacterium]|nr:hypothetical protein [Bdellovibrionales bacterium]
MAKKSACTQYDACVTEFKKHPKTWFNQYRAPTPEEFAARIDRDLANQPVNMESSDESFLEESEHDFNKNRDDALSQYKNLSGLQTKCACLFDVTGRAKPFFKVLDDKIQSFEAKQKELAEKQKKANERNKVAAKKAAEKQKQAEALQSKIQAERDAKDSTPACRTARAKKNYCERMKVVRTLELQIEHEKEVGRQSGYVDAARLNGNTSAKITLEQLSEKDRATYKEVSGKSISRSDCPIEDQPPFGVKLGPSIAAEVTQSCGS